MPFGEVDLRVHYGTRLLQFASVVCFEMGNLKSDVPCGSRVIRSGRRVCLECSNKDLTTLMRFDRCRRTT